ncbi:alpha/beta hydrolase [Virgibacillus siamensis]|uniref:alpha/beta hydrolase n=1 Tax=Virgibacillus siamensis TaxID=480071 RepID=UPI00098679C2|nr:alpha/beta fold hydrolase [Virgibacillus siamensis]
MIGCLVIHGYTGGPYEVDPLVTYLKEHTDWHVEVPTLPGHGKKLALHNVPHTKWLETAEEKMKQLKEKYDTIYVIGFSMGGMIASYLAAKYPTSKLVLLAPAGKFLSFRQMAKDVKKAVADGFKGNLRRNKLFLHYKRKLGEVPFKANIEFLKLVRFTRKYLKELDMPVLIAQGQQDGMVPYKTVYYMDKEITSDQTEVIFFERSRHLICLGDDKDTLNQLVHEFLMKSPN